MRSEAASARSGSECEIKARDATSGMGTKRALVKTGSYIVKLNNVQNMENWELLTLVHCSVRHSIK